MQMGFRWYGEDNDKISLADIKQIPGVTSIVWALHHKLPGEVWTVEEIAEVQKQLEPYGSDFRAVTSILKTTSRQLRTFPNSVSRLSAIILCRSLTGRARIYFIR